MDRPRPRSWARPSGNKATIRARPVEPAALPLGMTDRIRRELRERDCGIRDNPLSAHLGRDRALPSSVVAGHHSQPSLRKGM